MPGRLSVFDRAELATDVGPSPRNVTVLLVVAGPVPDVDEVRARMASALAAEPRLGEQVRRAATGPVWRAGPVDLTAHVRVRSVPGGDPVDVAVDELRRPLPAGRPAWRLTLVDLADDERSALVWTNGHVLGNGPSVLGLLLDHLTDGPPAAPWRTPGRRPPPGPGERVRAGRPGRSRLVRPVTAGLTAVPVSVDLTDLRAGARTCGATVNDALLWAWGRAFRRAGGAAGGRVVLSVPVTVPGSAFGNQVGALRVAVPAERGPAAAQLAALAARTRAAKRHVRPWAWSLAPAGVLVMRRLGLLPMMLRRQRLISTVVTHAPGPPDPLRVLGVPVVATVPLVPVVGNVTTAVAAVSVGGRLDAAVVCSPESAGRARALADDLRDGLREIAALGRV
ncbi:diacylglycerol O-acyltransferase [Cellulomonas chitinilytica]|uniref:Diacylglycerol O-acyltransferase n=1 Tax=Cellulomonas chitinilytica TaxID=398759 RepID=A0A919P7R4_9CELL|nr:WS/DGAT domain-containing protein [Cellulomonas chitinilytica]GIG23563.1 diacylglycerol O-acyltransferase [Cellulomonas chitinilytica]